MIFIKMALSNIFRNRRRATTTLMSILIGVAMIAFVKGLLFGLRENWGKEMIDGSVGHFRLVHQDYDDWPIEPYLVISAWIAIDEATVENGCIQILPGSHREMFPLVPTPDEVIDGFPRMAKPGSFDDSNPVNMELKPGQFFLFNERLLHRSSANNSAKRRMGLAVRCITPIVRILDQNDSAILISGTDRMGFNKLIEPPLACD